MERGDSCQCDSWIGTWLAVDLVLASQLLPDERDSAKDLDSINTAIFLPMIAAPILAGIALNALHSYTFLYLFLVGVALIAAALIIPIKRVC